MDHAPDEHEEAQPRLRVIIADDDPLARRVVRDELQSAGVIVIAEAADGREAVEQAPDTAVLILSASGDEDMGMLALRCGAAGFLVKDIDLEALPRALRSVRGGEAAISRSLTMRLIERYRQARTNGSGLRPVQSVLSGREWEVLDRLCEGAGTDEIADALVLSTETVRSHIKNILRKLQVSSRNEAVAMARELRDGVQQPH